MYNNVELSEPWYWTDQDLAGQLTREINDDHVLYGKEVKTLARRRDNDDVLFMVDKKIFAVVHLTWSNGRHRESHWPITYLYDSWSNLYVNRILKDKKDFELG